MVSTSQPVDGTPVLGWMERTLGHGLNAISNVVTGKSANPEGWGSKLVNSGNALMGNAGGRPLVADLALGGQITGNQVAAKQALNEAQQYRDIASQIPGNILYNGDNTINSGGSGGSVTPNYISLLQDQATRVQNSLPGLLANYDTAYNNAVKQGTDAYNQAKDTQQLQYDTGGNQISDYANGAYNSLMSLLGRYGQGGNAPLLGQISNLLNQYVSGQSRGLNQSYNSNKAALDTSHAADMTNWMTQRDQGKASATQGVQSVLDNLYAQIAAGGGVAPMPTGDVLSSLQRSYSVPAYQSPSVPALSAWNFNPAQVAANVSNPSVSSTIATPQTDNQDQKRNILA
jgi:hypothetical protein